MTKDDRGVYVLVIDLTKQIEIKVGSLGRTRFMPGKYLYVGRAKQYLKGRLSRHLREDKKSFWHIDYLLKKAHIEEIWIKDSFFDECRTASSILSLFENLSLPILGFGSSDCRCPSHLIYFSEQERALSQLRNHLEFKKAKIHENES